MEKKKKERLDVLLVKRGLAESREKAKAVIMAGNVFVKEQRDLYGCGILHRWFYGLYAAEPCC